MDLGRTRPEKAGRGGARVGGARIWEGGRRVSGLSYLEQRYPERRASEVWYPQPCNWNLSIIIGFRLEKCLPGHF